MIAFYLMFYPWMHAMFYWEGLGSMIEGLYMMDGRKTISLRKMGRNSNCIPQKGRWRRKEI